MSAPSLPVVLLLVAVAPLMACVIVHISNAPNLSSVDVTVTAARPAEPPASAPARERLRERLQR